MSRENIVDKIDARYDAFVITVHPAVQKSFNERPMWSEEEKNINSAYFEEYYNALLGKGQYQLIPEHKRARRVRTLEKRFRWIYCEMGRRIRDREREVLGI